MKKSTYVPVLAFMLIAVIICIIAINYFDGLSEVQAQTQAALQKSSPASQEAVNVARQLNNAFIAIAKKANPSVVTIFTDKVVKQPDPYTSPFSLSLIHI